MDFETKYTKEQEEFRVVVKEWLDENAPRDLNIPADGRPVEPEMQERMKRFRRKMGKIGWLAPAWPREMGGGGLSPGLGIVIQEELRNMKLPSVGDNRRWINAMLVWGSEEQKRRFIPPALRGEIVTWQAFGEPEAGSDTAGIQTRAVLEGEEYVIDGIKAFITGRYDPDYLVVSAVTDPARPRRFNLGIFMVDATLPGITIKTMKLLAGSERMVYLDHVHVPGDCLIGTRYLGWEIAQTILQQERGEVAFRESERGTIDSIEEYLREERASQ